VNGTPTAGAETGISMERTERDYKLRTLAYTETIDVPATLS
jgi:hypothetical protein